MMFKSNDDDEKNTPPQKKKSIDKNLILYRNNCLEQIYCTCYRVVH